ncbi:DUF4411 family protein [Thermocrinis sp.]|jgi:hypothetical protein|uniref:DUF4411 family protein n=1 Tax=Thermocrinis sp. TaxID=2024383 RepID=UPI002637411F|nr:DUF4411 family protein [Thermocrinis sp.]
MKHKVYLLDTNIFIEPYRTFYSFDYGTAFWDFLKYQAKNGQIFSIDKVYNELSRIEDQLFDWVKRNLKPSGFFRSTKDINVLKNYQKVIQWAEGKRGTFKDEAIEEFKEEDNADPWLVAYAMHYRDMKSVFKKEIVIVTQEKLDRNRKNKIPIPIVCEEFSVECCDLFTMLRELGFKIRFEGGI